MFCQKCGNQLNGTENVCPNCGMQVNNTQANMNGSMGQQPVQPQFQQPMPQYQQPNQFNGQNNNQPNNNKTVILIVALIAVVAIAIVLFLFVFKKDENPTQPSNNTTTTPTTVTDQTDSGSSGTTVSTGNKASYGGYSFTIPAGYETETTSDGLTIYSNDLCFIIQVDHSHTFEDYIEGVKQKYPSQASQMNINGRQYINLPYEEAGKKAACIFTKASSSSTFVVVAANRSYTTVTSNELEVLDKIISSAAQGNSTFGPSNNVDAGKDGLAFENNIPSSINFKN